MQPTPRPFRIADTVSGVVLLAMLVLGPWAFGTTQAWSIWTMNAGGYLLGALLALKWVVRWKTGFRPSYWQEGAGRRWPAMALAFLTVLILAYVLTSAMNARALIHYTTISADQRASGIDIEYLDSISWLPQSYDGQTTLRAFWKYLGMAMAFWAARDWLKGMTRRERRMSDVDRSLSAFPPQRLQWLLWTLLLSTAVLSIVGILQRLDGSNKLLFLVESRNRSSVIFGPFPYRGTATDYLNLIWPLGLALWWALREKFLRIFGSMARTGNSPHVAVLPLIGIIAIGPFLTSSRGGVLVELGLMPVCALILWTSGRLKRSLKIVMVAGLVLMAAVGWQLGGGALAKRFQTIGDDKMSGREEVYENGERLAADFALFGSGAETFPKVYFLYRADPTQSWAAYAHDDYLETRITFGWVGFSLILAALILVPLCTQFGSGIPAGRTFLLFLLTSLGGLMLHARFDPSFQNYSVHFTFLILCAVLSCLSAPRR